MNCKKSLNEIDKERRNHDLLLSRMRFAMAVVYPSAIAFFVLLFLPSVTLTGTKSKIAMGLLGAVVLGGSAFIYGKKQKEGILEKVSEDLSEKIKQMLHLDKDEKE